MVQGRTVPARRFNLDPGSPSRVLHAAHSKAAMPRQRPNLEIVAHPILWSIPSARSDEAQESLPVQPPEAAGPLFSDRHQEAVRWHLPAFVVRTPSEDDATLVVRDVGVDRDGTPLHSGVLTFRFETHTPDDVSRALAHERQARPDVKGREIPLTPKEVLLTLTYTEDGETTDLVFTAPYDADRHEARFELRASALKLAYAMLAERDGVDLKIVGDYNAWVPVDAPSEEPDSAPFRPVVLATPAMQGRMASPMHVLTREAASGRSFGPARGGIRTVPPHVLASLPSFSRVLHEDHSEAPTSPDEAFAFAVDDVFSITGRGTVVAGTVLHGRARVGDRVIFRSPNGQTRSSVLTSLKRNRQDVQTLAEPGPAALTLRGIGLDEITGGARIVRPAEAPDSDAESTDEPAFAKQRQIFEQTVRLHLPCSRFPHTYRVADGEGSNRSMGCTPPWSDGFRGGARYRLLDGDDVALPADLRDRATVYESLHEVGAFLLVPRSYVITRTTDTFAPTASMTSILDPENASESKVVFDLVVAPDLLPFDVERIRDALRPYLARTIGEQRAPTLQFPTVLPTSPELSWSDPFTVPSAPTVDGDAYALSVETRSIGKAAAVVQRLRDRSVGLNGALRFALDATQSTSSSLHVSLGRTSGPALTQERLPEHGQVVLRNGTGSPLVLHHLLFRTDAEGPSVLRSLDHTELRPDESHTASLPTPAPTRILADYTVQEDTSRSLSELRVDVGILEVLLAIDTDLQPHEVFGSGEKALRVTHIRVHLKHGDDGTASVTIASGNDDRFGSDVVSLLVPLDRYLQPEHRTIAYQVTFHLATESGVEDERTTDWLEHNYGHSTNLTVRRQQLRALVSEPA